jgi:hypothetical protein
MRNGWSIVLTALLGAAPMVAGCGGSDGTNDEIQAQAHNRNRPGQQQAAATVSLSGCLEAAPGNNQYVLRNVRFEPRAGDPHAATTTSGGHGITEGSWVRLDGSAQDFSGHLGERVKINGTVSDDGRNTIGTAGTPGVQTPTGETSQAASSEHHSEKYKQEAGRIGRESMADGTAAQLKVQEISGTGDRCAGTKPAPPKPGGESGR